MKQDSFVYPLKLTLGFLAVVVIALLFCGCGSYLRVEYDNPQYGDAAVQFTLPKKEGYAK